MDSKGMRRHGTLWIEQPVYVPFTFALGQIPS
jgi:hypothetical protein